MPVNAYKRACRELFRRVDKNENRKLNFAEFQVFMPAATPWIKVSVQTLKNVFKNTDLDKDGQVSWGELRKRLNV